MKPTSKFFGKSLTLWGLLITSFCSFFHNRTGVNVADQVQPVQDAITGIIGALQVAAPYIGQLGGAVMVIVGRINARQALHFVAPASPTPPTGASPVITSPIAKASAAIAMVAFFSLSLGLVGCGTTVGGSTGPLPPSGTSAAIESALPLIRTGAAVATGGVLNFAVTDATKRTALANKMYGAASAVYSLTGGTVPTPVQHSSTVLAFGGSQADANYAQFSTAVSVIYAAYYAKIATGDTKTAGDLLNAIAGGVEDATQSYVTTPVAAPSLSFSNGTERERSRVPACSLTTVNEPLGTVPMLVEVSF